MLDWVGGAAMADVTAHPEELQAAAAASHCARCKTPECGQRSCQDHCGATTSPSGESTWPAHWPARRVMYRLGVLQQGQPPSRYRNHVKSSPGTGLGSKVTVTLNCSPMRSRM